MFKTMKKFWSDEQGAEGLEKLLIIGAVVIPLLGILLYFKTEISQWVNSLWGEVESDGGFDKGDPG